LCKYIESRARIQLIVESPPVRRLSGAAPASRKAAAEPQVRPRIRVLQGAEVALGPGKVALLASIATHGSLADAARALGMSYMRAWHLIQTMNGCFREPLVTTRRGGQHHGGAALSATGSAVLALYHRMEAASLEAIAPAWAELRAYLAPPRRRP
jgi:molybdate transport system regulatory protein